MISTKQLTMMKKTALLINTSRGPIVNERDLADALNRSIIAGRCRGRIQRRAASFRQSGLFRQESHLYPPLCCPDTRKHGPYERLVCGGMSGHLLRGALGKRS